jgi:hypothetical protein
MPPPMPYAYSMPQPTYGAPGPAYFCPFSGMYYPSVTTCEVPWMQR